MAEAATDSLAPVSHEVDGRILTGVGVSADDLAETMERHTADIEPSPASTDPVKPVSASNIPPRDDAGKFSKPSRGQRRFDELTREREDARREAEAARQEAAALRARLDAPRAQEPAKAVEPVRDASPQPAKDAPLTRPKPTEDEIGAKYQSYGDFVEDLADWKAEQRLAALDFDARIRQSIEADRASRDYQDRVQQTLRAARDVYADFDAVITTGPGANVTLGPSADVGESRVKAISLLPNGTHLIYAIAKDAALAQRLASMSDLEFGMALSSIAPSPAVATPASTPQGGSPVVPAPYQPVGSGSKTASVPSSELTRKAGFDFDKSGYREKRAAERAGRR